MLYINAVGKETVALQARDRPSVLILGQGFLSEKMAQDLEIIGFNSEILPERGALGFRDFEDLKPEIEQWIKAEQARGIGVPLVHPGVGVWAERPEISNWVQGAGGVVVGPQARVITRFADKLLFLLEIQKLGLPQLLLANEPLASVRELERELGRERFPVVLKSLRRGGAGIWVRVFHSYEDMRDGLPLWMEQLERNVGSSAFFVERYLESSRKIAVPFVRFQNGFFHPFSCVDASLQSRHRKILELAPAPHLETSLETRLYEMTQTMAVHFGFVGVGAFEFLVEADDIYVVQGLPRLNSGYPLWEKLAGISAVELQIEALEYEAPRKSMTELVRQKKAGLFRIYAEDSQLQIPQPGKILELSAYGDLGKSVTLGTLAAGHEVDALSDGLLGMGCCEGDTWDEVFRNMNTANKSVWIAGTLQTNQRFLEEILVHPWVREGMFHSAFVDEDLIPQFYPERPWLEAMAGITEQWFTKLDPKLEKSASGHAWMVGDRFVKPQFPLSALVDWTHVPKDETDYLSGVLKAPEIRSGESQRFLVAPLAEDRFQVRLGEWGFRVRRVDLFGEKPQLKLLAQLAGRVHALLFREQAQVSPGDPLLVIESLQALVPHPIGLPVRILRWKVRPEDLVSAGQELAELERIGTWPQSKRPSL